jgi:class 3 adenylate cyclase/DNA-binding SARP family transcriptional activator/tetratricopeptide (TPR) repeat protein
VAAGWLGDAEGPGGTGVRATLLGPFSVTLGEKAAGPWVRPSARRLCELVLVSPGRRIGREAACEALFPGLGPAAAANALSKALSLARTALSSLGEAGLELLSADRGRIWASTGLEVDFEAHEQELRSGLLLPPGPRRDQLLALGLDVKGVLLEDEPYADWALRPRENLESLRQEARLAVARDRARGFGRSAPADIVRAWEACFSHDPACEEAASALLRAYTAQRRPAAVAATYRRCREGLESLGLRVSPALAEVFAISRPEPSAGPSAAPLGRDEERRLVSAVFAELSGPAGAGGQSLGPEELRELVGGALADVIAHVEALDGTVTSVSGAGLVALFGAPTSHEDDPERALLAAFRAVSGAGAEGGGLSVRAAVETGPAVVGLIEVGASTHYGAMGEVVGVAAALQSVARRASVLVGPVTRAATEGLFEWGPTEEVAISTGEKPLHASYLERPRARPAGQAGRRRLARSTPLVGRAAELDVLREALREATIGKGGVAVVVGEPGLGKTRLVYECRKLFMAWVGAASGRLPLWLEGRAASYASSRPYGLYQQLLSAWVGVAPEEGEEVARSALEQAMRAAFGGKGDDDRVGLLCLVMGFRTRDAGPALARLGPEQLQRATFAALMALISRLLAHGPTVLALEDLHWADPTSLRLTEELSSLTKSGPLLLLLTRRPEPDPGVSGLETALGADPNLMVRKLELAPLGQAEERGLARALLGEGSVDEVTELVCEGADGNPLFLEERLSLLTETHALVRAEAGGWRLEPGRAAGQISEALERLVRSRVDRLSPGSHEAIVGASVLGPEFGLNTLGAVTDLNSGLVPAVYELCAAGLLVELRKQPEPVYRFRHGLIQEATYHGLLRAKRRRLHARAAWALEETSAGQLEEVASLLGHHFAMAGDAERAVHYLELAGDHAASVFANEEAIASYRRGLELLETGPGPQVMRAAELWSKLGDIFNRTGRLAEARPAFQEAAGGSLHVAPVLAARAYCSLGCVETEDHRYEEALAAFDAATELLEGCGDKAGDDWVETWLKLQDALTGPYYWRNEPERIAAVLARVRPVVEARGTAREKAKFYTGLGVQRFRASRYLIDEGILADLRSGSAAALEGGLENELSWPRFEVGFASLWHRDLVVAQTELEGALAIARRVGDRITELRCLTYLACARLRQHDLAGVKDMASQNEALAGVLAFPEYVGMAKAMLSWVAWKEGRFAEAELMGREALGHWRTGVVRYPFYWVALWPLMAVRLAYGRCEEAVAAARELVSPDQMRLPIELQTTLESAMTAWDSHRPQVAAERLTQALRLAEQLDFA